MLVYLDAIEGRFKGQSYRSKFMVTRLQKFSFFSTECTLRDEMKSRPEFETLNK